MKKTTLSLLVAPFFVFTSLAMADCNDVSRYPDITKAELTKLISEKKAFIVDVNDAKSFNKKVHGKENHVTGAINFASNEKDWAMKLPVDKNALIVAYCGGPKCKAWQKAAKATCNLGYQNIKHYSGGISGWMKSGT